MSQLLRLAIFDGALFSFTGHEKRRFPFMLRRNIRESAEPADKPGSVVDNHSSRLCVTTKLKQPTRRHCGPQHSLPIWSCSRWGLPYRSVARLAVRSYRTISPLPFCRNRLRRYLSVALSVGFHRPGVTWHRALWSPDFPRRLHAAIAWPTPRGHCLTLPRCRHTALFAVHRSVQRRSWRQRKA